MRQRDRPAGLSIRTMIWMLINRAKRKREPVRCGAAQTIVASQQRWANYDGNTRRRRAGSTFFSQVEWFSQS